MCSHGIVAVVVIVAVIMCNNSASAIVDYCSDNTFKSNTTWLQFTKEMSSKEYVISGKFKSLHCCAKGYTSIEWFKDNKAYPWPSGVSNLILYPEATNQTVYSQTVDQSDEGNYTCIASNETHQYQHSVELHVIDASSYTGAPLPTYTPQEQYLSLGSQARLFCEAFVGRINLPDAHNEVKWRRGDVNASFTHRRRFHETSFLREDQQVLGSYLLIREVTTDDYGSYLCSISNTWFQSAEFTIWIKSTDSWRDAPTNHEVLLYVGLTLLLLLIAVGLFVQFGLTLRRLKPAIEDGKEFDVLVCYNESDTQFVLEELMPTLQTRYKYYSCTRQLPRQPAQWLPVLRDQSDKSRRLLVVLSPSALEDVWTHRSVDYALHLFMNLHPNVLFIMLQAVPLGNQLSRANVVYWPSSKWAKWAFWATLRLRLPPNRSHVVQTHRANSTESLEVLFSY